MRIATNGFIRESTVDGPGLRVVVFTQGCPHRCPGCHNRHTWDPKGGEEWDVSSVIKYLQSIMTPLHQGLTISGGEPFEQAEDCARIAEAVKQLNKDVTVYTGYRFEQLQGPEHDCLLSVADYLIDGQFEKSKRDMSLKWRGSSNQRVWKRETSRFWVQLDD